jgi:hypothetical protein
MPNAATLAVLKQEAVAAHRLVCGGRYASEDLELSTFVSKTALEVT